MRLQLLARATRDLAGIEAYISLDNPQAAADVGARLARSLELIASRPEIGRPTLISGVKEWSVPGLPYVIPYKVVGDAVQVLRIFHTSRERPRSW